MNPDHLYELNRQKIQGDRAFILKEKLMKPKSDFGVLLLSLGNWMIVKGQRLRKRYSLSRQMHAPAFLQDKSSIFRA
jgi:hypothetical protein